jgi:hypothetical protein
MASCDVTVELDAPAAPEGRTRLVDANAQLHGSVVVELDDAVRCNGLDVELRCIRHDQTTGGKTDGGRYMHAKQGTQRLFSGDWAAGTHRYPFTLQAPYSGYAGDTASWYWVVRASADIPWADDPSDRVPLTVRTDTRDHRSILYQPLPPVTSGGATLRESLMKYGIGFLTLPALSQALAAMIIESGAVAGSLIPVIHIGLGVAALLLMIRIFRNARRRERLLLGPDLDIEVRRPGRAYRGGAGPEDQIKIVGVATRRAPVAEMVNSVWVEFNVIAQTAKVTSNQKGPDSHYPIRSKLWSHELRLDYQPDDVYRFELPLPDAGSMPFSTGRDDKGRGVYWEVSVRIVRDNQREDERATCEIEVRPASSS